MKNPTNPRIKLQPEDRIRNSYSWYNSSDQQMVNEAKRLSYFYISIAVSPEEHF